MVMTFVLTPLSHYNSIAKPRARFLLSLLEDLTIDFLPHFIISVIDFYQDMVIRDKVIFPSAITRILCHFFIPIHDSPYYTVMGAIRAAFVWWSEAQLRPKWPQIEMIDPAVLAIPFTSTPSSLDGGVTFEAIMAQL